MPFGSLDDAGDGEAAEKDHMLLVLQDQPIRLGKRMGELVLKGDDLRYGYISRWRLQICFKGLVQACPG